MIACLQDVCCPFGFEDQAGELDCHEPSPAQHGGHFTCPSPTLHEWFSTYGSGTHAEGGLPSKGLGDDDRAVLVDDGVKTSFGAAGSATHWHASTPSNGRHPSAQAPSTGRNALPGSAGSPPRWQGPAGSGRTLASPPLSRTRAQQRTHSIARANPGSHSASPTPLTCAQNAAVQQTQVFPNLLSTPVVHKMRQATPELATPQQSQQQQQQQPQHQLEQQSWLDDMQYDRSPNMPSPGVMRYSLQTAFSGEVAGSRHRRMSAFSDRTVQALASPGSDDDLARLEAMLADNAPRGATARHGFVLPAEPGQRALSTGTFADTSPPATLRRGRQLLPDGNTFRLFRAGGLRASDAGDASDGVLLDTSRVQATLADGRVLTSAPAAKPLQPRTPPAVSKRAPMPAQIALTSDESSEEVTTDESDDSSDFKQADDDIEDQANGTAAGRQHVRSLGPVAVKKEPEGQKAGIACATKLVKRSGIRAKATNRSSKYRGVTFKCDFCVGTIATGGSE